MFDDENDYEDVDDGFSYPSRPPKRKRRRAAQLRNGRGQARRLNNSSKAFSDRINIDVRLQSLDKDMMMKVSKDGRSCKTRGNWHGVRATHGVTAGKFYYEAIVVSGLCRVGWAGLYCDLNIGTNAKSFGYGGTGKKAHRGRFEDYGDEYGPGDCIGCYLDLDEGMVSWSKNGQFLGEGFDIPDSLLRRESAFFPACTLQAGEMKFNFGARKWKNPPGFGYLGVAEAEDGEWVHNEGQDTTEDDVFENSTSFTTNVPAKRKARFRNGSGSSGILSMLDGALGGGAAGDPFGDCMYSDDDGDDLDFEIGATSARRCGTGRGLKKQKLGEHTKAVKGLSEKVEKDYVRLDWVPDAMEIRSRATCIKALNLIMQKWKQEKDYHYACNQFKSLRQDLKVQHIADALMIRVYEVNARICCQVGDFAEFNTCQTQLRELYKKNPQHCKNAHEFVAYRIMYSAVTKNSMEVLNDLRQYSSVKHDLLGLARKAHHAISHNNYHEFFTVYKALPKNARCILDQIKFEMRYQTLLQLTQAYCRGCIPTVKVAQLLGFSKVPSAIRYLRGSGILFKGDQVDCEASNGRIKKLVPKSKDDLLGVTHGAIGLRTKSNDTMSLDRYLLNPRSRTPSQKSGGGP